MKQNEKKELLKVWNTINDVEARKDYCFKELQEMSRDLGLSVWCSALANLKQLDGNKTPYTKDGCNTTYENRAWYVYNEYVELEGKESMLMQLGSALSTCKIWGGKHNDKERIN